MSKTYSMAGWRIGFAAGNKTLIDGADAHQVLSRLRRLHADPGRGDGGAERPAGLRRRGAQHLQGTPRRADRGPARGRLGSAGAGGQHVRLGADPQALRRAGLARLLQAAADAGQGRGLAGHRLRRAWRRACPHRPGREQAPHPPGRPQHPPGDGRSRRAPSTSICAALGTTSRRSRLAPERHPVVSGGHEISSQDRHRRSRHRRRRRRQAAGRARPAARAARRPAARSSWPSAPARSAKKRDIDVSARALGEGSAGAGDGARHRRRGRADRRLGRRRARGWSQTALAAGKHVVTANKALLAHARRGARGGGREEGRAARLRGGGRRRHPDHQGAARGPGRQPHQRGSTAS